MSRPVPPRPAQPRLRDEKGRFIAATTNPKAKAKAKTKANAKSKTQIATQRLLPEPTKAPRRTLRQWFRDTLGLKG